MNVKELMLKGPVIPVLVIDDIKHALPLAESLVEGGLSVLEVTLRTPHALEAIRVMAQVHGATVGVGTALNATHLKQAADAGAQFAVSPGFTDALGQAASDLNMPLLPGIANSADIMRAKACGYNELKFFPASQAGGPTMLKALGGPFHDVSFCPTGGVNAQNAKDYLTLSNVLCVGGSWVAPKQAMQEGNWSQITELAQACSTLT